MKQFLKEHAGATIFQVDAGGLFNHRVPDAARSRAMLEGVEKLGVDIINLSPADAAELERLGQAGKVKQPQFVTANVFGPGHKTIAPPFLVRRASDGTRLVFIGLSEASVTDTFGYTVENAQEALKRLLPQVAGSADVVVLLAFMPNRDVVDIAANVPGVDMMVSAAEEQFGVPPYQIGSAWVLQSQYEGRFVGHVGLQVSAEKHLVKPEPNAIAVLDASFADDPEMAALLSHVVKPVAAAKNQ